MLCDECGINPANIHVTQIVDGERVERNLCSECALRLGITDEGALEELGSSLFGFPDLFSNLFRRKPADRIYDFFSESAQKVIHLAREEAKRLSHDTLTTEHLLLGIIKEEGVAAKTLESLGVNLVELFSSIETAIGRGPRVTEDIGLSPRAKKVFELAYQTARELGFNYVGSEHLLLGLLREGESLAAHTLVKHGINLDKIIKKIVSQAERIPFGPGVGAPKAPPTTLSTFSRDLTQMARENKLDPVIDREKEIDRVIRILSRRTKNNPALLGDPGVGKTAIAEGLAQRIVKGDVPESLKDKQVLALDLSGMLAGTKYRGEFEARVKKVMDEIRAKAGKIILFIDELHTLVGAGAAEGAIDAANILKPALAKGELQCVGATTVDEYRKYIEKDAALERRFQPINVDEPSVELSIEILKGLKDRYEAHHRVKIPDEVIVTAVDLAKKYITDRFLPDKAIDLIDEAAAKVRLRLISPTSEMKKIAGDIERAKKEKEAAIAGQQFEKAAKIRDQVTELEGKLKKFEDDWKKKRGIAEATVTREDIAEIVADWKGIPVVQLTEEETTRLLKMEEEIHRRLVGQDEAVSTIAQAIRRGRAGLKEPNRPTGSFIFAGPTGVGKTELARSLAEFLFGSQDTMVRLDMSEYQEKHTVSRLVGAPPGYVGFEEGGQLTEAVRRRPYSVILFDEIEKAHPDVFNTLLQILEDGRLTDGKGRTVDFKNTVIIMTSNVGARLIAQEAPLGFAVGKGEGAISYEKMRDEVLDEMKKEFRPEFLNRVDEIIVFHPLTAEQIKAIVDLMLKNSQFQVKERQMTLTVKEEVKELLAREGFDPKFGARPLRRAVQRLIENPLSNEILAGKFKAGDAIVAAFLDGKIVFQKT